MHRIECNVQTGEVVEIELTQEEIDYLISLSAETPPPTEP